MKRIIFVLWLSLLSLNAFSQSTISFLARSSFSEGYNLPTLCFFFDSKPFQLESEIFLKVTCISDPLHSEIWKISTQGLSSKKIFEASANHLVTDPVLFNGEVWWSEFNEAETTQILKLNKKGEIVKIKKPGSFIRVQDLDSQESLIARVEFDEGEQKIFIWNNEDWKELISAQNNKMSYLFSPKVYGKDKAIFKVRLGDSYERDENRPDQIILLNSKNEKTILLQDKNASVDSPYISFRNNVVVQDIYWSVIAKTEYGDELIIGSDSKLLRKIKLSEYFNDVAYFSWALTDQMDVILRAKGKNELRESLWLLDGSKALKLLDSSTVIITDLGSSTLTMKQSFTTSIFLNNAGHFLVGVALDLDQYPDLGESMGLIKLNPIVGQLLPNKVNED